jgi:hypothetical protein
VLFVRQYKPGELQLCSGLRRDTEERWNSPVPRGREQSCSVQRDLTMKEARMLFISSASLFVYYFIITHFLLYVTLYSATYSSCTNRMTGRPDICMSSCRMQLCSQLTWLRCRSQPSKFGTDAIGLLKTYMLPIRRRHVFHKMDRRSYPTNDAFSSGSKPRCVKSR